MGIVHIGSFAASSQSVKSTKVPVALFRIVGGAIWEYGPRLGADYVDSWQMPQNPSPMVERAREHPRLAKEMPHGRRVGLGLGTLFAPKTVKNTQGVRLLLFFHGDDWLLEIAVAHQRNMAVISVQAGPGSGTYANLFADPIRFPKLIADAKGKSGLKFGETDLGGWSAGCGAPIGTSVL